MYKCHHIYNPKLIHCGNRKVYANIRSMGISNPRAVELRVASYEMKFRQVIIIVRMRNGTDAVGNEQQVRKLT